MERLRLKVTLANDAVNPELGVFDLNTFTLNDAFTLENETGLTVRQMINGLDDVSPASMRALVWFLKWKRGDGVHVSAVDFNVYDLSTEVLENPTKAGATDSAGSETNILASSPITAT